jgi:hypothetical protein
LMLCRLLAKMKRLYETEIGGMIKTTIVVNYGVRLCSVIENMLVKLVWRTMDILDSISSCASQLGSCESMDCMFGLVDVLWVWFDVF